MAAEWRALADDESDQATLARLMTSARAQNRAKRQDPAKSPGRTWSPSGLSAPR